MGGGGGMGGGSTTTKERPGALDFLNADVVSTIAPYIMQNVAADLGGGMTADRSDAIRNSVAQGLQSGSMPGTAQFFQGINKGQGSGKSMGQGVLGQAMMLYGKQPPALPSGGSTTTTPGLGDYTQSLADIVKLLSAL